MTYKLDIEIPGNPASQNTHKHWRLVSAERKKWRNAVCMIAKFRRPEKPLEKAKLTLTRYSSREMDYDNRVFSFKSCIDGLKDAGVILDDKDSVIVSREYPWIKCAQKDACIRIVVEEA